MSEKILIDQKISEGDNEGTAQTKAIRGKVAKVLSDREIALNIGKAHNVVEGMIFDIIPSGAQDFEIQDPDTGEMLGIVRPKAKARVKVVSVNDKFSLAATYRLEVVEHFRLRGDLLPFTATAGRRVESFKTREASQTTLEQQATYVASGDVVVQVIGG